MLDFQTGRRTKQPEERRRNREQLAGGTGAGSGAGCAGGGERPEEDARAEAVTEATLLTAMETAGKTLDEKELSDAMKEAGWARRRRALPSSKCC